MKDLLNRVQQQLNENHAVEAEDIQALTDYAKQHIENETANDIWKKIFDYVWDGTEGSPEDINQIMCMVSKYGALKEKEIIEIYD